MTSVEKVSVVETPQSPGKIVLELEVLIIKKVFQISFRNLNLLIITLLQKFQRGALLLFHNINFKNPDRLKVALPDDENSQSLSLLLISKQSKRRGYTEAQNLLCVFLLGFMELDGSLNPSCKI